MLEPGLGLHSELNTFLATCFHGKNDLSTGNGRLQTLSSPPSELPSQFNPPNEHDEECDPVHAFSKISSTVSSCLPTAALCNPLWVREYSRMQGRAWQFSLPCDCTHAPASVRTRNRTLTGEAELLLLQAVISPQDWLSLCGDCSIAGTSGDITGKSLP